MTTGHFYAVVGAVLFGLAAYGFWANRHVLRQILALNIMGSATFLMLVGAAQRAPGAPPDPVPQALVLTGIVIAVSATAVALVLLRRWFALTGRTSLSDDRPAKQDTREL